MKKLDIIVDNKIRFDKRQIDKAVLQDLKRRYTTRNPTFISNQRLGYSNHNTPSHIFSFEETGNQIAFARGCGYNIRTSEANPNVSREGIFGLIKRAGYQIQTEDRRIVHPAEFDWNFEHDLFPFQEEINRRSALRKYNGIVIGGCASGKTVIMARNFYTAGQRALMIVDRKDLMYQTKEELSYMLGVPMDEIGQFGDGKKKLGDRLNVGLPRTLAGCIDKYYDKFGFIAVDEAHDCAAPLFHGPVARAEARFKMAYTATLRRKDKKEFMIFDEFGPIVDEIPDGELERCGRTVPAEIRVVKTDFNLENFNDPEHPLFKDPHYLRGEIVKDKDRNDLIVKHVLREYDKKHKMIVISDWVDSHLRVLYEKVKSYGVKSYLAIGANSKTNLDAYKALDRGEIDCIFGTSSILTKGINVKSLNCLFITVPTANNWLRTKQMVGRVKRSDGVKDKGVVYYFLDHNLCTQRGAFRLLKSEYADVDYWN